MTIPREQYWDYKTAIEEIKKKPTATTFISTNCASVFAYYFDKNIFKKSPSERLQLLAKHNVFESTGTLWMDTVDFFRYKDIYITSSFGNMFDPTGSIKRHFDTKFKWVETLSYKGLIVNHYSNILIDQEILKNIKLSIINDIKWYNGVILQAKEENISTDSMLTNVAIWQYKNIIK